MDFKFVSKVDSDVRNTTHQPIPFGKSRTDWGFCIICVDSVRHLMAFIFVLMVDHDVHVLVINFYVHDHGVYKTK